MSEKPEPSSKTKLGLGQETLSDVATGETLIHTETEPGVSAEPARDTATAEPTRGDTIGRFVVLGLLGEGGMGLVYSAYDPHLDRKVAIKLLHAAAIARAADARTRLLREAQAMAKIDHPNVIKVHEVGMFGQRVYVAMEFAEGGTVRAWLQHQRSVREVVDKFVQAGHGLAAAHAAGLIHRDFKPDNVLLAKDGTVRVTDFGLVSAMHAVEPPEPTLDGVAVASVDVSIGSTPLSQNLTRTGSIMGTPSYMAPEQFGGGVSTARTDQFSFCVALHEALYGQRPFRGATFDELAVAVTQGILAAPSSQRDVPAWLRRVVLRGLSTSAGDRFGSMAELLSELVGARRRKRIAAIAGAGAIAIGIGTAYALWPSGGAVCRAGDDRVAQLWNPTRRDQIKAAFAATKRPHAVASFDKVARLFEDWSRSWALAYADACEDSRMRGVQSEHMLDLRMQCLSRRLDETAATLDLLASGGGDVVDHSVEAALHLPALEPCADVVALSADVPPPDTALARSQVDAVRGKLDEAHALELLGRYKAAREAAAAVVPAARATEYAPVIGEALLALGRNQVQLAQREAIPTLREAMHVAASAGDRNGEVDATAWLIYEFATQHAQYEVAQELADLADATTQHVRPRPEVVVRLGNAHGLLDVARGKLTDAQARYDKTLAFAEKAFGADHLSVLTTRNQLANVLKAEGKFDAARAMLERVVAVRERLYGKDHPDVASALNNLGNVYRVEGKLDDAKRLYDRALSIRLTALGPDHPEVATSYNNLGTFFSEAGDEPAAEANFRRALAIWENVYGPASADAAQAHLNIGSSLSTEGKYEAARVELTTARQLLEAAKGPDDPTLAMIVSDLAVVAQNEHKLDEALAGFRQAEAIATKAYGPSHPDVVDYLANEATVLKAQKKLAEAKDVDERVVVSYRELYGPDHVRVGMGLSNLADVQAQLDDEKGSLATFQQALAIFEAKLGKTHPNVSYPLLGIADALIELHRAGEAVPYAERAVAIRTKMPPVLAAEAHDILGRALAATPATRARGVSEVEAAAKLWDEAKDADSAKQARAWLAKHR